MFKTALVTLTSTALLLLILTACSDDDQSSSSATTADANKATANVPKPVAKKPTDQQAKRPNRAEMTAPKTQPLEAFQSAAIMAQPVDFSSPESITSSLAAIQKEAGDDAASRVETAIDYMLVYDLSVGRNKDKLYAKLNGKTPNQILAMTNR